MRPFQIEYARGTWKKTAPKHGLGKKYSNDILK